MLLRRTWIWKIHEGRRLIAYFECSLGKFAGLWLQKYVEALSHYLNHCSYRVPLPWCLIPQFLTIAFPCDTHLDHFHKNHCTREGYLPQSRMQIWRLLFSRLVNMLKVVESLSRMFVSLYLQRTSIRARHGWANQAYWLYNKMKRHRIRLKYSISFL